MTGAEQKAKIGQRLIGLLWRIHDRMSSPQVRGVIAECAWIAPMQRRAVNRHMPGLYPHTDRCPTRGKPRHIVMYEAKLTVIRYWDLMNTDETVGLSQLLNQLEYYADHGWNHLAVTGDVVSGYGLVIPKEKT